MDSPEDSVAPLVDAEIVRIHQMIQSCFPRSETRLRALRYMRALASHTARNGSEIARASGDSTDGMQRFLSGSQWDCDAVLAAALPSMRRRHDHPAVDLCLVPHEFVRQGTTSAGVRRSYLEKTRRTSYHQTGGFLIASNGHRSTIVDRELLVEPEDDHAADQPSSLVDALFQLSGRHVDTRPRWLITSLHQGATSALFTDLVGTIGHDCIVEVPAAIAKSLLVHRLERAPQQMAFGTVRLSTLHANRHHLYLAEVVRNFDMSYHVVRTRRAATPQAVLAGIHSWTSAEHTLAEARQHAGLEAYSARSRTAWRRHMTLSLLTHLAWNITDERLQSIIQGSRSQPADALKPVDHDRTNFTQAGPRRPHLMRNSREERHV